ncbi:MAG: diguanylate cyclase, partial [Deferribacterales bacterium]
KTLKSVIEVSPIPLCLMDKRGRMININNMFTETFGYTLEEISITRSWWRLIYPDAASRQIIYKKWKTYVRQSGKGFTPEPIQTVAVCKDGTQRDILFHFSSMKDMAVAAFYDITSRVETEKKLQEYIDIVDKNVAISNTDEKGYITSASEAFSKLCGYTVSELLGKRHEIMHHPDVSAEQYKELVRTIATAKTWSGELKKLTRDGEVFWTDTRISPVIKGDDIAGFMYIDQDITDKKRIEELSVTDKLTGIYNRIRLDSALYDEFLRFKRLDEVFSIILFDIDFFKKVNDTYGHLVGDDVLRALAKLVKSSLRETDIFGRWGGEEFLVVCCGSDEDGSYTLAEKLRQKVALYEFPAVETLTCSFGVAQIDNDGTDAMIKRADDALYAAKQNGRNRVER